MPKMTELHELITQRAAKFSGNDRLAPLLDSMFKIADVESALREHAQQVGANASLTAEGKRAAIRKNVGDVAVKHLAGANKIAVRFKEDLAAWENRLVPPTVEKTDAASAVMHAQIRDRFVAMSPANKIAFMGRTDLPTEVFSALVNAPDVLSGLDAGQRGALLQSYRATHHAGDVAQIALASEAIEQHEAVAATAAGKIARTGDWMPHEFAEFAKVNGG